MAFCIAISTYARDEIKKLSQRYADRREKHPNILAINHMKTHMPIKKKTIPSLVYLIVP